MMQSDSLFDKYGPTMTPNCAAKILHMHPSHVRALCKSGDLPAVKIGERWIIPTAKLVAILGIENAIGL